MNYLRITHSIIKSFINLPDWTGSLAKRLLVFLLLFTFNLPISANTNAQRPLYGIIVPTQYETDRLQQAIQHLETHHIEGVTYDIGTIHDKNIVFVISGLGKINTAAITSRLIKDFHPELILLSGSAGSVNPALQIGDVIIGKNVIDVDLGHYTNKGILFSDSRYLINPQINRPLPLEFKLNKPLLSWIQTQQKTIKPPLKLGIIATSDALPNSRQQLNLLKLNKVDVIEMEGAAMMHTCWLFNTSCIVVRGVSNNANTKITSGGIKLAADNSAKTVIDLILAGV